MQRGFEDSSGQLQMILPADKISAKMNDAWLDRGSRTQLGGTRIKHPMKGILQREEVPRMPAPRHSAPLSFGLYKFSLRYMDQVAPDLPNSWNGLWSCLPTTHVDHV